MAPKHPAGRPEPRPVAADSIHPDIRRAETLPAAVYRSRELFEQSRERIFARSWQLVGDADPLRPPGQVHPFTLLPEMLDEPLVLARGDDDRLRCLSNVCTHRGNLVAEHPGRCRDLRCRYHGRRFGLDGRMLSMPEFEEAKGFPSERDHLPELPLETWGKFLFTSLDPVCPFDELAGAMRERLSFLPLDELTHEPSRSRDYLVRAHWALYVENYLEGFHIPFVHAGLAQALDYGEYTTEVYRWSNLQLGVAADGEDAFDLPESSPDHDPQGGRRIAAYYWWLYPNLMMNVYPWGISVNLVLPLAPDRTKVSFRTYVHDPSRLDRGAGAGLDRVEREDEAIVEAVQRGVRSRLYDRGRYSPTREQGVHHFHRLLAEALG
jgi:choline monooxygenase